MLHEYTDLIKELRAKNAHFDKICQKHDDLNDQIDKIGAGNDLELEKLKKEKLLLKDEIYAMVLKYKNEK